MTPGRFNVIPLLIVCALILPGCHAQMGAMTSTPLHQAVANQDVAAVKASIAGGAGVNAKDEDGGTPLHVAAQYEHAKITKMLLQGGADAAARDKDSKTPRDYAIDPRIIRLLNGR